MTMHDSDAIKKLYDEAFSLGQRWRRQGGLLADNPFTRGAIPHTAFDKGWTDADQVMQSKPEYGIVMLLLDHPKYEIDYRVVASHEYDTAIDQGYLPLSLLREIGGVLYRFLTNRLPPVIEKIDETDYNQS